MTDGAVSHSSSDREFDIRQYELLFARNSDAQKARLNFMQLSIPAVGAYYAAILSTSHDLQLGELKRLALWLPVALGLLGFTITWALREGMRERGAVMAKIEERLSSPGWETERKKRKNAGEQVIPNYFVSQLYWVIFTVACIYAAFTVTI